MEKTKMMKEFQAKTGNKAMVMVKNGTLVLPTMTIRASQQFFPSEEYIDWVEAKATAYDRIMSGGKKTLKEWANILQMCTAVNSQGEGWASNYKLEIDGSGWWPFNAPIKIHLNTIPAQFIDFSGDWKTSLTLPDGWEEK